MISNNQRIDLDHREGFVSLTGNDNHITVTRSKQLKINLTGNNNQLFAIDSGVSTNITGNNNTLRLENVVGDLRFIGNGNNVSASGGAVRVGGCTGNGNNLNGLGGRI